MKSKILFLLTILFVSASTAAAQNQPSYQMDNISQEITKISKTLETFNKNMKAFMERFALTNGNQLSEKHQKLLLGFEILNKAEQRLEILQKFQIELVEKESAIKSRLAQIEMDIKPEGIDRSVTFAGTTKTEELRENRRQYLGSERNNLQSLISQIRSSLSETTAELRRTENLVQNLRKKILPQIEMEIADL
jgi:uncharacterized protein YoxC